MLPPLFTFFFFFYSFWVHPNKLNLTFPTRYIENVKLFSTPNNQAHMLQHENIKTILNPTPTHNLARSHYQEPIFHGRHWCFYLSGCLTILMHEKTHYIIWNSLCSVHKVLD